MLLTDEQIRQLLALVGRVQDIEDRQATDKELKEVEDGMYTYVNNLFPLPGTAMQKTLSDTIKLRCWL